MSGLVFYTRYKCCRRSLIVVFMNKEVSLKILLPRFKNNSSPKIYLNNELKTLTICCSDFVPSWCTLMHITSSRVNALWFQNLHVIISSKNYLPTKFPTPLYCVGVSNFILPAIYPSNMSTKQLNNAGNKLLMSTVDPILKAIRLKF